jgi:GcrA cell cycle regulator
MSSGSAREAVILKLWSQGVTRSAIRERLCCGAAAIDEALRGPGRGRAAPRLLTPSAFWTPERTERARSMWLAGESAAAIAAALGASRNAVLGKLARLGVARSDDVGRANREAGSRKGAERSAAARAKVSVRPELKMVATPARPSPSEPEPEPLTDLMGLEAHMCRWPIGEPDEAGFGFCGRRAEGSFCPNHRRRAYLAGPLEPIERLAGLQARETAPGAFDGWERR